MAIDFETEALSVDELWPHPSLDHSPRDLIHKIILSNIPRLKILQNLLEDHFFENQSKTSFLPRKFDDGSLFQSRGFKALRACWRLTRVKPGLNKSF